MTLTASFIDELIHAENPLEPIWSHIIELWQPERFDDIEKYYDECEEDVLRFEQVLDRSFPTLYHDILPAKCTPDLSNLSKPSIWLDGMSIREAQLLARDFDLKVDGPYFPALPSKTSIYRREAGIKPSMIQDFTNPTLTGEEEEIWCPLPDKHLKDVRGNDPPQFQRMYDTLKECLSEIIEKIKSDTVTITSDHGYVDVLRSQREGSSAERRMRKLFGNERFMKKRNAEGQELKENGHLVEHEGFYFLKGRRCWTKRGKYARFPHGGISLMECLLPTLRMEVK